MMGAITGFFGGIGIKIVMFLLDKALAGIINGTMTPESEEKLGEYVDGIIDRFQKASGDAGKIARGKAIELCDKIKENLLETD